MAPRERVRSKPAEAPAAKPERTRVRISPMGVVNPPEEPAPSRRRERVRQAPVADADPAPKVRTRGKVPAKKTEDQFEYHDTSTLSTQYPGMPFWWSPDMPKQWPNGSAYMRASWQKKYVPYRQPLGSPDELNPNLVGRVCRMPDGRYTIYRWMPFVKKYKAMGTVAGIMEGFAKLRPFTEG